MIALFVTMADPGALIVGLTNKTRSSRHSTVSTSMLDVRVLLGFKNDERRLDFVLLRTRTAFLAATSRSFAISSHYCPLQPNHHHRNHRR